MGHGQYRYQGDLQALEAMALGHGPSFFRPAAPLRLPAWHWALADHPDKQFCSYILQCISHGFHHIGVNRLCPNSCNMLSVRQQPQLVEAQIRGEVEAGRLLGPLPSHLACLVQTNPIGLIPKPHQPGKWRLTVNLSSQTGASVNDAISTNACHMHYASFMQPG